MNCPGKKTLNCIIPMVLLLLVVTLTGYKYRGLARLKMLNFLHSFDDLPASVEEDEMPPGAWWPARDSATIPDSNMTDAQREQL
ncbi:MAG: hypothetical protein KAS73_09340, partial [Candidatus Sabulitectum sp.]|nr:hypothetical protein [Candidatus Sabulitectum sp.]